ncbi:MAG TPA: SUMF1/EgtB/PvdO family nonheme iron enzyme [Gemmataceae bacterium]|nr:SUMF1/EgtB/PvdO family nonheme iron enzyme [Gemmataceae bacterium]
MRVFRCLCDSLIHALILLSFGISALLGLPTASGAEVTLQGSLVCNGACMPEPKGADHVLALFAIDGTAEVRAEVERIVTVHFPEQGLDADGAQKLMDEFSARLKYYIAPDSPALKDAKNTGAGHYCMPATASAVTGTISEKEGKKWIAATRIEPCKLKYPAKMLTPDKPFVMPSREPVVLKIGDKLTLRCVQIPVGKFLMGTPFYMWPYHVEEYPHLVTLTQDYFLAEIPITQEIYEAVMGSNPSIVKDPQLPVQNPLFADTQRFCDILSEKNGKKVRLPTSAEWEYAARVGTSNPAFAEKYHEQNSSGPDGYKSPLKVKSKKPSAWGLYDMASCWWEITGDKAMYHVRKAVVDPHYPPGAEIARSQRTGRGIVSDRWSICTHEFITEKADYAGQKFRVLVEIDSK